MSNLYNPNYQILFEYDPVMQAVVGRFDGYALVLDAVSESRDFKKDDQVGFVYQDQSSWRECVRYIKERQSAFA